MNILKSDAILAMDFLKFLISRETKTSSAIDFALQENKSLDFTYQVCRKLRRAGLINTSRGRKGGYAVNSSMFNTMTLLQFYSYFGVRLENNIETPINALVLRISVLLDKVTLKEIIL